MPFVRPAVSDDLEPLARFDEWKRATEASIRAGACFVAGHDAEVLAYGILDRSFFGRAFIAILFVHPEHRRTGLGTRLVEHFESITTDPRIWISTNIENLGMQKTLQRRGFRRCGVVNELADLPELIYTKDIDPVAMDSGAAAS